MAQYCLLCLVQYGIEFVAEHVLPFLMPLLTAQQLNVQQFAKYMLFVKDMLRYWSIDTHSPLVLSLQLGFGSLTTKLFLLKCRCTVR